MPYFFSQSAKLLESPERKIINMLSSTRFLVDLLRSYVIFSFIRQIIKHLKFKGFEVYMRSFLSKYFSS